MKQAAGAIELNDTSRPAAESAAARMRSRWRMVCVTSIVGMFGVRGIEATLIVFMQYTPRPSLLRLSWPGLLVSSLAIAAIVSAPLSVKHGRRLHLEERRRRAKLFELHDLQGRQFVMYLRSFTDDLAGSRLVELG